ncbi:MAG: S41 family peptidase [Leadbetterella sp.]
MKKYIFILIIHLLHTTLTGQTKISSEVFKKDLEKTRKSLEKYHLGLFRYQTKSHFDSVYLSVHSSIKGDSLDQKIAFRKLSEVVTSVKDLHTSPHYIKIKKGVRTFPLVLKKIDSSYYLNYNCSKDTTLVRGLRVTHVDGESIDDIVSKFYIYYGPDNGNPVSKEYYTYRRFDTFYYYAYGEKRNATITFKTARDSSFTKRLEFLSVKEKNAFLSKRYKNAFIPNFKFEIADSVNKVAILSINSFMASYGKLDFLQLKFKRKLKKSFKEIKKQDINHLVLDFRRNGGGFVPNIGRLTRYVANKPFQLMDSTVSSPAAFRKLYPVSFIFPRIFGHIYYKKNKEGFYSHVFRNKTRHKPRKRYHYDKNLYVIMDGGSYSATTFTIGLLKDMNRATFVGTPPGGANWGSYAGNWKMLKLRESGFKVRIPLYKIVHNQPNRVTQSFFVQPDYFVTQTYPDLLKRKDTEKTFILNLIRNQSK